MGVSYNLFTEAFLQKVTEYDFIRLDTFHRTEIVDGYMKRACAQFHRICKYDLVTCDDAVREFKAVIPDTEIQEIVDIVTEGMLVQWMKPYVYAGENLRNMLNTSDFSSYSPAELLYRIKSAYEMCRKDYTRMVRDYSYRYGDLTTLHQ